MRFRLRTLLILMAVLPPLIAGVWMTWGHFRAMSRQMLVDQRNAQIAELRARQNASALKLKRLQQEYDEKRQEHQERAFQLLLLERQYRNEFPDQPQAEPGIYFLGPELVHSNEVQ